MLSYREMMRTKARILGDLTFSPWQRALEKIETMRISKKIGWLRRWLRI